MQSSSVDGAALRAYLRERLPDYLVPARFEVVGELPLTVTGKIDRSRAVADDTERLLARLWSRVLGVESVGPEDDFFALGGDSIGVLELFTALAPHRAALPRPTVLYRHRTLAELAAVIDATPQPAIPADSAASDPRASDFSAAGAGASGAGASGSAGPGFVAPVLPATGDFPVTLTQRGFLLADAIGVPSTWLAAPRLHGPLDLGRFRRAVGLLVARHPMLRTVFPRDARPPVQREIPSVTPEVGYEPAPRPLDQELAAEREHRFDPAVWPLVRLRLLRYGPDEHVLLIHAHHLVGDGYSVALLMRELSAVHDGAVLEPLRATFREYVSHLEGIPTEIASPDGGPIRLGGAIATAGFTVGAAAATALRERAMAAGTTPFAPVLAAYHSALASVTGRPDPMIGVAVTGRDHSMPGLGRIFGPCATAVAVRPGPGAGAAEVAAAVTEARTRSFTAPQGWRHFFTYLDFGAPAAPDGATLRLSWDDADAELAVPPGTEVLLAVRPVDDGLRLTLRTRLPQPVADRLAAALADALHGGPSRSALTAALVGYLPAPEHLAALAGALPDEVRRLATGLDRETIRRIVFPDGGPRLLEIADTPLGRSGFIAVPRFADELSRSATGRLSEGRSLAEDVAAAVDLAAEHGARTVSLAGMIPANTGYGAAVRPYRRSDAHLTTGHAVTAAAVVRTVMAALAARDRKLPDCVVAVLGVGSIGTASLSLLLARAEAPASVILCDLPAAASRLLTLAASLDVPAEVATGVDAIYRADVIVAATSSGPRTLDVDRLRPGTILVDDSFPHCFDVSRALARMRADGDVLIAGGGLLDCGETVHESAAGLPAFEHHLPGSMASCRLESLLHAAVPGLPLVGGPVTPEQAAAYWDALDTAGIGAAPLHLLNERLDTERDV
ncbi:condensation domain-containing protein [Actinoplanes sp. CA-252034]|uniref:condensation domain-containing protein n=1 Tax=Actinoplanes sp. CA-252034 TaxID=3239906 RepID=UPI003D976368